MGRKPKATFERQPYKRQNDYQRLENAAVKIIESTMIAYTNLKNDVNPTMAPQNWDSVALARILTKIDKAKVLAAFKEYKFIASVAGVQGDTSEEESA